MKPVKLSFLTRLSPLFLLSPSSPQGEAQITVPAYKADSWVHLGEPPGGIGYDIRHSFTDPDTWFVTELSGFHISTDRGLTWALSSKGIGVGAVFSATVDPHDSNIIWAGTRDPGHVYKSTDGGASWMDPTNGALGRQGYAFRGFIIHPHSSDIVYAMAEVNAYVFREEGVLSEFDLSEERDDYSGGRIFKTIDGGFTWTMIWQGAALARYLWINPQNPNVLYVSTGIFDRRPLNVPSEGEPWTTCAGLGVLKSTNGGETWIELGPEVGLLNRNVGSLFMHPEDPQILLAGAGAGICPEGSVVEGTDLSIHTGGAFLTTDGGNSWKTVIQGRMINSVEFCAANPNIAYAGGELAFHRSEDGGHTWQTYGDTARKTWGPPGLNPGKPIDIQTDPSDCSRVLLNNYTGGVFISNDGGKNWSLARGYSGARVWDIYIVPSNSSRLIVAENMAPWMSDNGGVTWQGLVNNELIYGVTALAGNPYDPDHLIAVQKFTESAIFLTHDGGNEWKEVFQTPVIEGEPFLRFPALAFAPSDPSFVYGATLNIAEILDRPPSTENPGLGIYRSNDGGATWTASTDALISDKGFLGLAVSPEDPGIVYAGTFFDRGLFKSVTGGETWFSINVGLSEPYGHFSAIAIDPQNPQVVYAGGNTGLYRSTNGCDSWSRLAAGLDAAANISAIVIDPTNPAVVYVGTYQIGVFYSENSGELFHPLRQGLNIERRLPLQVRALALSDDGTVLYEGTFGGGVFRLGTPGGATGFDICSETPAEFYLEQNFPNPFNPTTVIEYALPIAGQVRITIYNMLGKKIRTLVDTKQPAGRFRINWNGFDEHNMPVAGGVYFYKMEAEGFVKVNKLAVVR